ncbi:MAG: insulinase family protein [Rhizomicrobium sp.]
MTFVSSGAVDHATMVALVGEKFARLAPGPTPPPPGARYGGGALRFEEDLEQAHIAYALPGVSSADPDFYVAQVYVTALGGGMSSRLFQEARERRGLCYAISAFAQASRDSGTIGILHRHRREGGGRHLRRDRGRDGEPGRHGERTPKWRAPRRR